MIIASDGLALALVHPAIVELMLPYLSSISSGRAYAIRVSSAHQTSFPHQPMADTLTH